ncbi:hypothetical protein BJV78DRAFT_754411 [Lactifluus subvellereus]|nr:hypothetical protein BJV78DRAFT_754411 [Lactifluus subvellereus]
MACRLVAETSAAVNSGGKGIVPDQDEPTSNYIQTWGRRLGDDLTKHQVNLCTSRHVQIPDSTKPPLCQWSAPLKRLPNGQSGWSPMSDPAFPPQHLNFTSYRSDPYQEAPQEVTHHLFDPYPSDSTAGFLGATLVSPLDRLRNRQPQPRGTPSVSTPLCFDPSFHGHGHLVTGTVDPPASSFFDTCQGPPILDPLPSFISYQGSEPEHFASPKIQPRTPTAALLTQNVPFVSPTREQHIPLPSSHSFLSLIWHQNMVNTAPPFSGRLRNRNVVALWQLSLINTQHRLTRAWRRQLLLHRTGVLRVTKVRTGIGAPSVKLLAFARRRPSTVISKTNIYRKKSVVFVGPLDGPRDANTYSRRISGHIAKLLFKRKDGDGPGTLNRDEAQSPLASCVVSSHTPGP